jgi:hypothetical protein
MWRAPKPSHSTPHEEDVMADERMGVSGVLGRLAAGVVLVLATYNPAEFSYMHWVTREPSGFSAPQALVGLLLLGAWVFFARSALAALGWFGILLILGLVAALVWLLVELGVLGAPGTQAMAWIALVGIGLVLGMGLSWSLVRRQVTGQVVVDDTDEG